MMLVPISGNLLAPQADDIGLSQISRDLVVSFQVEAGTFTAQ